MVIVYYEDIKHNIGLLERYMDDEILVKNFYTNDFYSMRLLINECARISKLLRVEIGGNYFFISKGLFPVAKERNYWLSNRRMEELIREKLK